MIGTPLRRLRVAVGLLATVSALAFAPVPVAAQEDGGVSIIRDTEIEAILRQDCDPIFVAAGLTPQNVQIHIVGDKELNAFSAAGQQVFLNTGLIIETKSPNQLIGVIAHETGHIAGGHIARSGEMGRSGIAPLILGMGLGILAAIAGAPDAAAGLIYSSSYFAQLSVLGYSRVQESAADQAAVTYLEKSGQSGEGLVEFFNNFRYQEVFSDEKKYPFFRDHPLSDDRIEALTARVTAQPHFHAVDSPEAIARHEIMKAKLEAFLNAPQQTFVEYPESNTSFPARYARAIAYYKELETDKAIRAIDALIAEHPNNPYLWELKGQVYFEAGRPKDAEPAHRRSVELKPDAPLLRINLGQTLVATEDKTKLDEAISEINRALTEEPDNALGWRLLSEAYDAKGEAGRARLAAAEQNFYLGQMKDARVFALRARDLLKKDTPEWRRATDIVLASKPSPQELQEINHPG
ncbi:M48 family metalloprotease [Caulobacter sp. KR2-114]|uniref:M48 family metalloprotease n=1 Tax=Caulobacter sp. KR2-114 TaxID=3400912 RepID=UPI003BFE7A0C